MNFVYWFLDSPVLHFIIFIIMLLIIAVIVSIKDVYKGRLSLALLIPLCLFIFSIFFPNYSEEILSKEHYIEFRVYQEEQKQKEEQERIKQEQERRTNQQKIELEIQKRLKEKGIKYTDHRTPR